MLWNSLAAMAVAVAPPGRVTATGVELLVVVPLPNWPKMSLPQAKMAPAAVRARLWTAPAAVAVTPASSGDPALDAVEPPVVVPLQSCPYPS